MRTTSLITLGLLLVPTLAGAVPSTPFSDVPADAWYTPYVVQAANLDIIVGYRDNQGRLTGRFGPGDPLTVAQILKMSIEAAGYEVEDYNVPIHWRNAWYGPYVGVATKEGFSYLNGFDNGDYDAPASRWLVAQIVADAFKRVSPPEDLIITDIYSDVSLQSDGALSIDVLTRDGVLTGDSGCNVSREECPRTTFRPTALINRAEGAKVVMNARSTYGLSASANAGLPAGIVVTYKETGFSPSNIHVESGTHVQFVNGSDHALRVSSNPHPTHTDLPDFDSGTVSLEPGDSYTFVFQQVGTWGYHNHFSPSDTGSVEVEP